MLKRDVYLIEKETIDVQAEIKELEKVEGEGRGVEDLDIDELKDYKEQLEMTKSFIKSSEVRILQREKYIVEIRRLIKQYRA